MESDAFSNITLRAGVIEIHPFTIVYPKTGELKINIKDMEKTVDLLPKKLKVFAVGSDLRVGHQNKTTGLYNGLLGQLQNGNLDMIFYPMPLYLSQPPGIFSSVIYEGGVQLLSTTKYNEIKRVDLVDCFLNFDWRSILAILIFFLISSLIIHKLFIKNEKIYESIFLLYRIMFKEHNIPMKSDEGRLFMSFILIYHLMLAFTVETAVNTNLVVSIPSQSISTIDDLWQVHTEKKVTFVKDHIANEFFVDKKNIKANEIYTRSQRLGNVMGTQNNMASLSRYDSSYINLVSVCDDQLSIMTKKLLCKSNARYILKLGILYRSPLIFKTLFAFLYSKNLKPKLRNIYDRHFRIGIEAGFGVRALRSLSESGYGYLIDSEPFYKECYTSNTLKSIQDSKFQIKIENTIILFSLLLMVVSLVFVLFIIYWLFLLKHKI